MTTLAPGVNRIQVGRSILLVIATALTVGCASAGRNWSVQQPNSDAGQVKLVPGAWNHVEALPAGARLVITLMNGDLVEDAFSELRPGALLLNDSAGTNLSVPRSDVQRIVAVGSRDGLTNGVLIGAGIGLGAALAILTGLGAGDGNVLPSAKWGAPLLPFKCGWLVGSPHRQCSSERTTLVPGADDRHTIARVDAPGANRTRDIRTSAGLQHVSSTTGS